MTHGCKPSGWTFCCTSCDNVLWYELVLAAVRWCEGHVGQKDKQEQLKQAHAAQVRALQDEHRRQQEELLQVRQTHVQKGYYW